MSETETGGPAFPPMHNPSTHHSGMTLRDWFAGQALTNPYTAHDGDADKVAEWAYQVADAMIFSKSNRIGTQAVRNLEAKLAKAVEALEPFAKAAETWEPDDGDSGLGARIEHPHHGLERHAEFTFGDLRRARATLAELKGENHDPL